MIKMCDNSCFHPHAYAWGISRQLLKAKAKKHSALTQTNLRVDFLCSHV